MMSRGGTSGKARRELMSPCYKIVEPKDAMCSLIEWKIGF